MIISMRKVEELPRSEGTLYRYTVETSAALPDGESEWIYRGTPKTPHSELVAFELFWTWYPRKMAKKSALKSWSKLKVDDKLLSEIMHGLAAWLKSEQWTKDDGQYIPYPATWLNNERWNDVLIPVAAPPHGSLSL